MLGGISPIQLVIVLVIVILIFGTKKLRGMGKDIGGAVKGFKQGMNDKDDDADAATSEPEALVQRKEDAASDDLTQQAKKETGKDRQTQDD